MIFRVGDVGMGDPGFLVCDWHRFLLPFLQIQLSLEMTTSTTTCQPLPDSFCTLGHSPLQVHRRQLPLQSLPPFLWWRAEGSQPFVCSQRPSSLCTGPPSSPRPVLLQKRGRPACCTRHECQTQPVAPAGPVMCNITTRRLRNRCPRFPCVDSDPGVQWLARPSVWERWSPCTVSLQPGALPIPHVLSLRGQSTTFSVLAAWTQG